MSKAVLIVDANDARRAAVRASLAARGLMTLEVSDPFSGLAALGRADFGAVIVAEGKRHLSLRGLIQLAKKRHGSIRIFVILGNIANADSLLQILGDDVSMVPPEWGVEQLGNAVTEAIEASGGPPGNPWAGESGEVPERITIPAPGTDPGAAGSEEDLPILDADVSLEGTLEDGSGAGLLMGLFAQELTGRLTIRKSEDDWPATLYFFRGEPVWADDPEGDKGLVDRLVGARVLDPKVTIDPVPQGTLLAHLVQSELVTAEQIHEVMRQTVREHSLTLATQSEGLYEFTEDRTFLDYAPILKLNPFGLIFESRRKAYTPDKLLAVGSEISSQFLHPGPGLGVAAEKLRPFMRDIDVSETIDGKHTVEQFTQATGLDLLMGTLMVLTMAEARLLELAEEEMAWDESQVNVARGVLRSAWDERSIPDVSYGPSGISLTDSSDGELSREEILRLYVRMKPITQPAQVLGVPVHAEGPQLEAAYAARMEELHEGRVPPVSDADMLRTHLEELRLKVQNAYDTLKLEAPAGGEPTMDSNPF